MATIVNVTEIGDVYDALELKIIGTLTTEYDAGRLKGKEYSEVMTAAISALINSSVMSVLEAPVKAEQIDASKADTAIKEAQSAKDLMIKEEQISELEKKQQLMQQQIAASKAEVLRSDAVSGAQVLDFKVKDFVLLAESEKERLLKIEQTLLVTAQAETETAKSTSIGTHDELDIAMHDVDITLKRTQNSLIEAQEVTEDAKAKLTERQTLGYNDQARVKRAEILNNTLGMFGAGGTDIPVSFTEYALAAAKMVSTEEIKVTKLPTAEQLPAYQVPVV